MGNILNKKLAKGGHRPARDTLPRYSFLFRPWMILIHSPPPAPLMPHFPMGVYPSFPCWLCAQMRHLVTSLFPTKP